MQAWKIAALSTLFLRLFLGLTVLMVWSYFRPFAQLSDSLEQSKALYGLITVYHNPPWDGIISAWFRWDAIHYINIAQFGYHAHSAGTSVFYPLYPLCTRFFALVFSGNYLLSALFVSTIACIFYLAGFYGLTSELFGEKVARWSLLSIVCYPFSVFLIAPYSESLFLALTIWMFIAARKKKWSFVGILGFASGLTRGPAILSSLALLFLLRAQDHQGIGNNCLNRVGQSVFALSPLIGGGSFLLWRYLQGYPSISQVLSEHGIQISTPFTAITAAIVQWLNVHDFYTTIDILSAALFLYLFILLLKKEKYPSYFILYFASYLILYLSKTHTTASSLQSLSRYVLTLFPAFWIIGEWIANLPPLLRFSSLSVSFGTLMILSGLYAMWVFIG